MSEAISVEAVKRLARLDDVVATSWRELVDGDLSDAERARLIGSLQGAFPHLLGPSGIEPGIGSSVWLRAALSLLDDELDRWVSDVHAPLDYLALALSERDSGFDGGYWTPRMAELTSYNEAPFGVRVLSLATDSLREVVGHLDAGLVRQVAAFKSDKGWVKGFLKRVGQLERWLGFKLQERLSPAAAEALNSLYEENDWRRVLRSAIESLTDSVPQPLLEDLLSRVASYEPREPENVAGRPVALKLADVDYPRSSYGSECGEQWLVIHGRPTRGR